MLSDSFQKLSMPNVSSDSFLNIYIRIYEVISSKWSTLYLFMKKEYQKYQLIRKHTSNLGLFNSDYSER